MYTRFSTATLATTNNMAFGNYISNLPTQAKILGAVGLGLWVFGEYKSFKDEQGIFSSPIDSIVKLIGIYVGVMAVNCMLTSNGQRYCDIISWLLVAFVLYGIGSRIFGFENKMSQIDLGTYKIGH